MNSSLLSEYFPLGFLAFLFTVSAAKVFETWNKKYGRKRINFQKLSRSGAGTRDIETAKKELEEFFFLRWPDSFIRLQKTKINISEPSMGINETSNAGDELENNGYGIYASDYARCDAITDDSESSATLEKSLPSKKCKKEQAAVKQKSVIKKSKLGRNHGAELDVMGDMSNVLNKTFTGVKDEKQDDKDDLFGKLVVLELKSLQQRQKYKGKHETAISMSIDANHNDVNHNERNANRIQSPTFHAEVNRNFQNDIMV